MGCLGETITVDGSRENGQNIAILFSIWKYINTISFINQLINSFMSKFNSRKYSSAMVMVTFPQF